MRIGVVIPVYHRPGLILECLESVASQSRAPEVVIVVDDASTDDTADRAESWMRARTDATDWRVLRQAENGGPSRARNRAIGELADCDVIAFLDSDDLWPSGYLAGAEAQLSAHAEAVAAVRDLHFERTAPGRTSRTRDCSLVARSPMWEFIRRGAPTPSSVVVRRAALVANGGFDETVLFAEDLDCYLALARDGAWVHVPGEPIRYRVDIGAERKEAQAMTDLPIDADTGLKIAEIVERFCQKTPPANARSLLSLAWFRAGCDAQRAGNWPATRARFLKSLAYQPWNTRAAGRWLCALPRT